MLLFLRGCLSPHIQQSGVKYFIIILRLGFFKSISRSHLLPHSFFLLCHCFPLSSLSLFLTSLSPLSLFLTPPFSFLRSLYFFRVSSSNVSHSLSFLPSTFFMFSFSKSLIFLFSSVYSLFSVSE